MNKMINICRRCDWQWVSRLRTPRCCPRCKSYQWQEPVKQGRIEYAKEIRGGESDKDLENEFHPVPKGDK